jgi:hypothetical protein
MSISRVPGVVALGAVGILATSCGGTMHHYSAQGFRSCLLKAHASVSFAHDVHASAVVLVWTPRFAEWVYFFPTTDSATAERSRLAGATTQRDRVLLHLLRAQWDNTLVFAPKRRDWLSPIKSCLDRARRYA